MSDNPYNLWTTRKSLGVLRDMRTDNRSYFAQWFPNVYRSTDEYIDFEKLPMKGRKLAPFALPLGRGGAVYNDSARAFRFKPAYVILNDEVDPLKPLTYQPGIDGSRFDMPQLTPMQRIELIKAAITAEHLAAWERRMEWLRARALIDGQVTLSGAEYPSTLVSFGRASNHTVTLTSGNRFGDSGVSILDSFSAWIDRMVGAEFGGLCTRITMSGTVAGLVRKDVEIQKHLDLTIAGGVHMVDRSILTYGEDGEMTYKFGELAVGGASGRRIELWVNDEVYEDPTTGAQTRYLPAHEVVLTAAPNRVQGHDCFGCIVDRDAGYEAIPLFGKNYLTGDDVKTEHISHKSAPISVPVNPNATLKAAVIAAA